MPSREGSPNKDKRLRAALIRYIDADPKRLDELVEKMWALGMSGNMTAMTEIANRLDGRAPQQIEGNEEDGSLLIKIRNISGDE